MAAALPLPAGLPLDATSWEQTPLVVRQVVVQLLAVIQQQHARIAALEARVSQNSRTSDRPPSSDPPCVTPSSPAPTQGTPGAKPGHPGPPHIPNLGGRGHVLLQWPASRCLLDLTAWAPLNTYAGATPHVTADERPAPRDTSTPAGEWKQVTVLCCGLVEVQMESGPEEPERRHDKMHMLYTLARDAVQRYGGTLRPVAGEYLLAVFGAPLAQEDHAQHAVLEALELQHRVCEAPLNDGGFPADFPGLRVGLHTGPVAVSGVEESPTGPAVVGDTVTRAIVLQAQAPPGAILCGETTAHLVQAVVQVEAIGLVPGAGTSAPATYTILGRRALYRSSSPRGKWALTPFVGRRHELGTLHALLAQVWEGRGQVVGVVGEPGIGKSRLVYEFQHSLHGQPLTYLASGCFSHSAATPYGPMLALLRQHCGLRPEDSSAVATAKLHASLQAVGLVPAEWATFLMQLLGLPLELDLLATLSPQALRARTVEALVRLTLHVARRQPLVGEIQQLFPAMWGLWLFYVTRGELQEGRTLGEQLLSLAQSVQEPALLLEARRALWATSFWRGELSSAQTSAAHGIALYQSQQHRSLAFLYGGHDPGVCCRDFRALTLWLLGYPDQALQSSQEALALVHESSHPFTLAEAWGYATWLHQFCREPQAVQSQAQRMIALSNDQGFQYWLTQATILRGWALAQQGRGEEGIVQMRQSLETFQAIGTKSLWPYHLALTAEAYGVVGRADEGLMMLGEALAVVHATGARYYEAELYRLKGELLLAQEGKKHMAQGTGLQLEEAEACFQQSFAVARRQQAKSLELRAAMSLCRLWQRQGKQEQARQLLASIYHWFTKGFDTADLQEAKTLLEAWL